MAKGAPVGNMKTPPQDEVRRYLILSALRDNRGPMLVSQVYLRVRALREKMGEPLTTRELKPTRKTKRELTWINETRQASRLMVDDGRMRRSGHGLWEITGKGIKWLEASTWLVSKIVAADSVDEDI